MPLRMPKTKRAFRRLAQLINTRVVTLNLLPISGALTAGVVGTSATTATFAAANADGALSFRVSNGKLPPGKVLNTLTGVLNGAPTVAGAYAFSITATDGFENFRTNNYTMTVTA